MSIVVVTGASAGVGRATAAAFAARGFDVALLARGSAGLAAAAAEVEAAGRRALPIEVDVSDYEQMEKAGRRVEVELGPVDIWVNDAMTTVFQRVVDTDPADFARAVEVTFLGQVWGTMVALGPMRARNRGTILNVGSALSYLGIPLQAAYCSSKFACRGFVESLRAELLEESSAVRVGMVHLPAVNTPQFDWCQTDLDRRPQPVPPIYQPEVAAEAIVSCAIGGRRSKVLGAWNKVIVVAASVVPAVANHFAAITGRDSQLTDEPVAPDRPTNLRHPADAEIDHGSHGRFDGRAGGTLDPHFLRTLPRTLVQLGRAVGGAAAERAAHRSA